MGLSTVCFTLHSTRESKGQLRLAAENWNSTLSIAYERGRYDEGWAVGKEAHDMAISLVPIWQLSSRKFYWIIIWEPTAITCFCVQQSSSLSPSASQHLPTTFNWHPNIFHHPVNHCQVISQPSTAFISQLNLVNVEYSKHHCQMVAKNVQIFCTFLWCAASS